MEVIINKPVLTIILPVGDFRPTIQSTIDSVLGFKTNQIQLLISDNTGGLLKLEDPILKNPATKIVVQSVKLSMADHWRNLMLEADGDWICFMGGDDGVVTKYLSHLINEIKKSDAAVISTHRIEANWNDALTAESWTLPSTPCSLESSFIKWPIGLASLFPHFFFDLPMPYNKAVFKKSLLEDFLASEIPLFDLTPDYFLAFLVAKKSKNGAFLDLPVFVHGGSKYSNGLQQLNQANTQDATDFLSRLSPEKYYVMDLPQHCIGNWLANSYLCALVACDTAEKSTKINRIKIKNVSRFYRLWVNLTCTSCNFHINGKTNRRLKIKKFMIDKIASVARNKLLPNLQGYRIPSHSGRHGTSELSFSLIDLQDIL